MNNPAYWVLWRKDWARLQNREFEGLGLDVRVTHESLAAQGVDRETIARNKEREMERQWRSKQRMRERSPERTR